MRLGFVVPSSNTVVEPLAAAAAVTGGWSAHFSRLPVFDVALDPASQAQFERQRHVEAARLLADANVDAIVWAGTSASWLGEAHDRDMCAAVEADTQTPASSCVLAMNALLASSASCRLGLVTPYTDDVQDRIVQNYEALGHACVASENLGGSLSSDFAAIEPNALADLVRTANTARPDVIFIMCTNLRGNAVADTLTAELGVPVVDSAAATIAAAVRLGSGTADASLTDVSGNTDH